MKCLHYITDYKIRVLSHLFIPQYKSGHRSPVKHSPAGISGLPGKQALSFQVKAVVYSIEQKTLLDCAGHDCDDHRGFRKP